MRHFDNDNAPATAGVLRFLSVCSGIEAASVAWPEWEAVGFAEIDKAASALLAYRYPHVPNYGDFTSIDTRKLGRVDILCGGTPCQAFSVAGARRGLGDARGNLSLAFVDLAHDLATNNGLRNAVWENVCGVLTMSDNAFGCFLAGLVGAPSAFVPIERKPANGKSRRWWRWAAKEKCHAPRWPKYGMVAGPKGRAAWSVKDAQYFGLAQRRERVLVVADFGVGADPAAVLFERVGVPWHPPARGEAREGVAAYSASSIGGYREGSVSGPVRAAGGDSGGGSENLAIAHAPEIARCVATREGSSQDYESTTMVAHTFAIQERAMSENPVAGPQGKGWQENIGYTLEARTRPQAVCITGQTTHALTAEGHDASEDGSGRGAPIVAFNTRQDPIHDIECAQPLGAKDNGNGILAPVCFTAKDYGGDAAVDIAPTLRAGTHSTSHQNGGVTPAVTVALRGREGGATAELGGSDATALRASSGGGDKPHVLTGAVRKLTPRECERLQGFQWLCSPDYPCAWQDEAGRWWSPDYTRIPVRKFGKPKITRLRPVDMWECIDGEWWLMTADGPRYKQLGNSWAVPKFRWLGGRIAMHMPLLAAKTADNDNQPLSKVA